MHISGQNKQILNKISNFGITCENAGKFDFESALKNVLGHCFGPYLSVPRMSCGITCQHQINESKDGKATKITFKSHVFCRSR